MDTLLAAAALEKPYSQICEEASEYLDDHGWCQGRLRTRSGEVCMMGAVVGAMGLMDWRRRLAAWDGTESTAVVPAAVVDRFNDVIFELAADVPFNDDAYRGVAGVADFNDTIATDKTDIQNQLLKTAKRLRNDGR